jgi:RND family efflux transporter MFP subunit
LAVIFLSILLIFASSCEQKANESTSGKLPAGSESGIELDVKTEKAVNKPLDIKIDITGSFESRSEVSLAPQTTGEVKDVTVRIGDRVKKGQVLIRLNPTDTALQINLDKANLQQERARLGLDQGDRYLHRDTDAPNVKKARAIMDNACTNWKRNIRMHQEDLIAEKEVENAYKDYLTAKADYDSAIQEVRNIRGSIASREASLDIDLQKLKYCTVISPVNGSVKERKVNPGDYVQTGAAALVIVEDNPLYLSVDIPQNFIESIQKGKTIIIKTDAVKGESFQGKIVHISPVINTETRTVAVKALMDNSKGLLKAGMFGVVSLITGIDNNAVLVPQKAVIEQMGVTKLFTITKDGEYFQAHERKIEKSTVVGDWIQVKGDIRQGEEVAISMTEALADGMKFKEPIEKNLKLKESPKK